MPGSLSFETERRIEAMFPPGLWAEVSELLLHQCGNNLPSLEGSSEADLERFRFAALKLSEGKVDKLKDAIELAKIDWRDLLMAAKFWTLDSHKSWFPDR